jgi:hypothetical protein
VPRIASTARTDGAEVEPTATPVRGLTALRGGQPVEVADIEREGKVGRASMVVVLMVGESSV